MPSPLSRSPDPAGRLGAVRSSLADDGHIGSTEHSPLLSPTTTEHDFLVHGDPAAGPPQHDPTPPTRSVWGLFALTVSIGGLQVAWACELSNGSPYLLSLGISKSLMALVWIAGPLTGTLVQPYVGMLSDNCRISWGRRKPFMLGGAAATTFCLLFLPWTKEIIGGVLGLFGADSSSDGVRTLIMVVAVIMIYVLDIAVNTVQASIRAFICDCAPPHQQEAANSMASRLVGIGNIIGYLAGYIKLTDYLGFLGHTQFQILSAIASVFLCSTVVFSVVVIPERDPRLDGPAPAHQSGIIDFFRSIFAAIKRLPPQITKVCVVQFCGWIGFFPMLFYTSAYIGDVYVQPFLEDNPNMSTGELDKLYEKATRVGTFALLIFAITSLLTNLLLPFFIDPTYDNNPAISKSTGESPTSTTEDEGLQKWLASLVIPGFTLRRAWMYSNILFAIAMTCTLFARTVGMATVLIGLVGITWALTLWAPWAIISAEISRNEVLARARKQRLSAISHHAYAEASSSSDRPSSEDLERQAEPETDKAGVILGIHNMAIAAPQFISTFGSSIVFRIAQKPRGVPGDRSISIVFAMGGVFVLAAAWFIHRIQESSPLPADAIAAAEDEVVAQHLGSGSGSTSKSRDMPRGSMDRASLARSSSFSGVEY
ncbi:general alpha-glucoside permease [Microdochium bolleyi]|uniref:General alpha-glucoside permease n=1 Tax=Microdochium bolleyi TaxID=196109 RepID=A0A136JJ61_9PEZI|nr:general alpha-glucoside permease [Microdochium bolleyi]